MIALEDMYKTAFTTNRGTFVWVIIPFGFKNAPPKLPNVFGYCPYAYLKTTKDIQVYNGMA
jgi:hypothetical protein